MVSLSIGNDCLWGGIAIYHYSGKVSYEEILISEVWFDYIPVKCDIKIPAAGASGPRSMEKAGLDSLLGFCFL